jgi:hypothetical protein
MPLCSCWVYFDIETSGLDPEQDKIITVQYQTIAYNENGNRIPAFSSHTMPSPGLHILKEWEIGEKALLLKTYTDLLRPDRRKYFEPVGNNLAFEGKFLKARMKKRGILRNTDHLRFGQLKLLDLYPLMILINNGYPTTAKFFGKSGRSRTVPVWYDQKRWDRIEHYIHEETNSFVKTLDYLMSKLPQLAPGILALHGICR